MRRKTLKKVLTACKGCGIIRLRNDSRKVLSGTEGGLIYEPSNFFKKPSLAREGGPLAVDE